MARKTTEEDEDLLSDLGVDTEFQDQGSHSARDQRIIAGFEEIERFVKDNGRLPLHGEGKDIFERLYATRLDQLRSSQECRDVLKGRDAQGLLGDEAPEVSSRVMEEPSDEELLADLAGEDSEDDITRLTHVRPWQEIKAAEEVATRNSCSDFEEYRPIFQKVQEELDSGVRKTIPYADNADVNPGDLFILHGQKIYVAECGDPFVSDYGRPDRRLRVIYDNGTESDLLVRSLQRGLNKDKASRRITEPDMGPLFSGESSDEDLPSGFVYIVRSKSDHPYITENRSVIHKIGVTGASDVKKRLANAKKDPTFLLAEVEVVGTVKLSNINRVKLEALLHRFFAEARLDLVLKDRFGEEIVPREWFVVPLPIIEEALEKLIDGSIAKCRYDAKTARIVVETK
jgi:hypothetical protein